MANHPPRTSAQTHFSQVDPASLLELRDRLNSALYAADAVILTAFGESGDSFRNLPDKAQDAILAVVSEKIDLALKAALVLDSMWQEVAHG